MPEAVTFVLAVHGDAPELHRVLRAMARQRAEVETEILVVDDGARAAAREVLASWSGENRIRVLDGERCGAAHALNTGIRTASHPWIAQVDQDVVLNDGWLAELLSCCKDPDIGAVQGYWVTDRHASLWPRIMGLDLEQRSQRAGEGDTDHVCTGNTLYRARALHEVGLFDGSLGYGYDNDMSYRLRNAGYRLAHCHSATSLHLWPTSLIGYLRQQYGLGYGRLDLIAKHPGKVLGDEVSDWRMILHVPCMAGALLALAIAAWLTISGADGFPAWSVGWLLLGLLAGERLQMAWRVWRRHADRAAFLFVPAHLLRDLAWVAALTIWTSRRLLRRPREPGHSMFEKRSRSIPSAQKKAGSGDPSLGSYNPPKKP